jgi:hypothetical protein
VRKEDLSFVGDFVYLGIILNKMGSITKILCGFCFILLVSFACKKEAVPPVNEQFHLTLMDSLVGNYIGYRYYHKQEIQCPDGTPPCNFTDTYDTVFVKIQVTKQNEDSLKVKDLYDGYCNRVIPMNGSLQYNGYPLQSAPQGYYKLNFNKAPHDSLFLNSTAGGGNNWGGVYYFYKYILRKE